ncbi:caspase family protein [Actinoplanes sp. NEAU-A12]|uniref:Caspase family protein n=1 Tax=Actinoplanes sandaracinus TaxID=3045177 RepID=A0ABT6WGF9_9ACTN|nr:caspase family protein [Actinoplanes sandaracinus]MDI6098778.1 caspase family protein [Actinoplanes sandaracinus]
MSGRREALVVAVHDYADPGLSRLRAPGHDADALARVLGDQSVGGFHVRQLRNEPAHVVSEALEDFFADRDRDDLLLVYFSGHGLKDEDGTLHLAAANTKVHRLAATSVSASFVDQQMTRSRSRRIVLMLDCCYAGAFARGLTPRGAASDLGIDRQLGGCGRAVITSSSAMEYAFEGSRLTGNGERTGPSVFTGVLVQGLETGAADRDGDGFVTLDEIYDYVYTGVREITPHQTPCKWTFDMQGSLHIARRPAGPLAAIAPAPVPRARRARWWWAVAGLAAGLIAVGIPALSHDWRQPGPSSAPVASPSPPAGPVLFHDDFTTTEGGWSDNGGTGRYGGYHVPGAYRFQSREPGSIWGGSPQAAAVVYPTAPSSIRISAWARWSVSDDEAWFGLACRVAGDLDAYYFLVSNSHVHIVKMTGGIPRFPELAVDTLPGVDLLAGVRLEADCATVGDGHATRLVLRIDGRQALDVTDTTSPLESGTVGIAVEMSSSARRAEAEFKDFTVARL